MSEEPSTPPQFGLIDVIEAFTAMRHEFRNQSKETREVAEELRRTAEKVERFTGAYDGAGRPDAAKRSLEFAHALAEIDHSVSRAVEAATRSLANWQSASDTPIKRVSATDKLASCGPITRFFCRRFAKQLDAEYATQTQRRLDLQKGHRDAAVSAIVSGLSMTVDHLRRRVTQHGIERIEVTGQPFDANVMRAVEVIDSSEVPPGHVAEQLAPAYRYNSRVIQFADVRLARP